MTKPSQRIQEICDAEKCTLSQAIMVYLDELAAADEKLLAVKRLAEDSKKANPILESTQIRDRPIRLGVDDLDRARSALGKWAVPTAPLDACIRVLVEDHTRQAGQIEYARGLLGAIPGDSLRLVADAARLRIASLERELHARHGLVERKVYATTFVNHVSGCKGAPEGPAPAGWKFVGEWELLKVMPDAGAGACLVWVNEVTQSGEV